MSALSWTEDIETPALLVEGPQLDRNIAEMAARAADAGVELWPHAKTHKCADIARRQLDAGAAGLTCQTLAEAEDMAAAGAPRVLVTMPVAGRRAVERAVRIARTTELSLVCDSIEVAAPLAHEATHAGVTVDLLIEIDCEYRRCGVAPTAAGRLAGEIAALPGVRLAGVTTYEGHLYEPGDAVDREHRARATYDMLATVAADLRAAGHAVQRVSVGSTAGAAVAFQHGAITEIRCGSYLLGDRNQVAFGTVPRERCALTVLTTVVSVPGPGRAVIDAGSKTLTFAESLDGPGHGLVLDRPGVSIRELADEHGMLAVDPGVPSPRIGERLRILPNQHALTINQFDELHVVDGDRHVATWPITARSRLPRPTRGAHAA